MMSPNIAATMTSSNVAAPMTSPNVAAPVTTAATLDSAVSGADAENTTNKQPSSSKVDNNPSTRKALEYNCTYDVTLQKTIDGYMLQLTTIESTPPTPYIENYYVAFECYKRHKGGIQSEAEKKE
jgi:hypothetical protein